MTKSLYEFKVGDVVWHVSEPGLYGTISLIESVMDDTIVIVTWLEDNVPFKSRHINGAWLRPKTLKKEYKAYSFGAMRHTHPAKY